MKKSKFQLMRKLSTIMAIGMLILQTVAPVGVAFATELDSGTLETAQTQDATVPTNDSLANVEEYHSPTDTQNAPDVVTQTEASTDAVPSAPDVENAEETADEDDEEPALESTEEEPETLPGSDLGRIFTEVALYLGDKKLADEAVISVDGNTRADLQLDWELPASSTVKAGDWTEVLVPAVFQAVNTVEPQIVTVNDVNVGEYTITDGVLKLTFNENVPATGSFKISLPFNLAKFQEDIQQDIWLYEPLAENLTIIAKPQGTQKPVVQSGVADNAVNPKEISWSIDVLNTTDALIQNGLLTNKLPAGLGVAIDVTVEKIKVAFNGELLTVEPVDTAAKNEQGSLTFDFGVVQPYEGYRVTFKTPVEKFNASFKNEAAFDNGQAVVTETATVEGLTRDSAEKNTETSEQSETKTTESENTKESTNKKSDKEKATEETKTSSDEKTKDSTEKTSDSKTKETTSTDESAKKSDKEKSSEATETSSDEKTKDSATKTSDSKTKESTEKVKSSKKAKALKVGPQAAGTKLDGVFKDVTLSIDGKPIAPGDSVEIKENSEAHLNIDWDTLGLDAKAGDWAEYTLPDVFKDVTMAAKPIELKDGTIVGEYVVENGKVKFIFNEEIEKGKVKNGSLELNFEFDLDKFADEIKKDIYLNDKIGDPITITVKPKGDFKKIEKSAAIDSDVDTKEIGWSIDVLNTGDKPVDGKVTDKFPDGLGTAKDFVVEKIRLGINGDKKVVEVVTPTPVPTKNDATGFEFNFDDIEPYEGYRIRYKTPIEKFRESFKNEATFDDGKDPQSDDDTISNLTRSNPIEKKGARITAGGVENRLRWTIDVNKKGAPIEDAFVVDNLPAEQKLIPNTLKVVKITRVGNTWVTGAAHPDSPFTQLPIELGDLTPDEAYRIEFDTEIDWSKVNGGIYKKNGNTFQNTAKLYEGPEDDDNYLGESKASVGVNRSTILNKWGENKVDYNKKELIWYVDVNLAKHPLKDVQLKDMLPEGLSLDEKDVEVFYWDAAGKLAPANDHTVNINGREVTIDLPDVGRKTYRIKYTTKITDFTKDTFTNTIGITGESIGPENKVTTDVKTNNYPTKNNYFKSFSEIDYSEKTIKWYVEADSKREAFKPGFTIKDTFPNDGLILLPDTLEVHLYDSGASSPTVLQLGKDYTLVPVANNSYGSGFQIQLIAGFNGSLEISYQTSYDSQRIVDTSNYGGKANDQLIPHNSTTIAEHYLNRAKLTGETVNNNPLDVTVDASKTVNNPTAYTGKKEGRRIHYENGTKKDGWITGQERKLEWEIYVDYMKQVIPAGLTVTDHLDYDGKFDLNTIKVYPYSVKANGDTVVDYTKPLATTEYNARMVDKDLQVTFVNEIKQPYVIVFETSVPNFSLRTYKNSATIKNGNKEITINAETAADENYKNYLSKKPVGLKHGDTVFVGDEVEWEVKVNANLSVISSASITDTMSSGLEFVEDSLRITEVSSGKESQPMKGERNAVVGNPSPGMDYEYTFVPQDADKTAMKIKMLRPLDKETILRYKTVVTKQGDISNDIAIKGGTSDFNTKDTIRFRSRMFSNIKGEWSEEKGSFKLTKVDEDGNPINAGNEASFELWYDLNGKREKFGETFTTQNGVVEIGNLPIRTYYLKEVQAPRGFELDPTEREIKVTPYGGKEENIATVQVENKRKNRDVLATKTWVNGPAQKPDVWFKLYRKTSKGSLEEVTGAAIKKLEDGDLQAEWKNLPETDLDGNEYDYSVQEVNRHGEPLVLENYEAKVDGLEVTNTYKVATNDIVATKEWVNGSDKKTDIWFQLSRKTSNGPLEKVGTPKALPVGTEQAEWKNLPEADNDGNVYTYSVQEVDKDGNDFTPAGFIKEEKGLKVTNTYHATKSKVEATKAWVGGPADHPTVWFQLFRNVAGETPAAVADADIKALPNGTTTVSWNNLEQTDRDGKEYIYTVKEVDRDGKDFTPKNYQKTETGLQVTNTYQVPVKDITATKEWVNGAEKKTDIWFQLSRKTPNGSLEKVGTPKALPIGTEQAEWKNLPETDDDGNVYTYSVQEVDQDGNDFTPADFTKVEKGLEVTNTYQAEKIKVDATKEWVGGPADRPTVWFQLYRNTAGETPAAVADADIKALPNGTTEVSWRGLDKTDKDGKAYIYTVKEVSKDGEDFTPKNYVKTENGLTVTNTYVSPKDASAKAEKIWVNGPLKKPTTWFQLFRNVAGETPSAVTDAEIKELADGITEVVWTGLAKTDASGNEYIYTVKEVDQAGKDFTPEGFTKEEKGLQVTNTYQIAEKDVKATKVWVDGPAKKPTIWFQLVRNIADGPQEVVPGAELKKLKDGQTEANWTGLPETDPTGNVYEYSVKEVNDEGEDFVPAGFTKEEKDLTVTNTYQVVKTDVTAEKIWVGGPADKPTTWFQLFRNVAGEEPKAVGEIKELAGATTVSWKDLATTDAAGNEYVYTVKEVDQDGNDFTPEGFVKEEKGLQVTNTYEVLKEDITAEKEWIGGPVEKPTIWFQLFRNIAGEEPKAVKDAEIKALPDGTTTVSWKDLAKTDASGNEYLYSVKEVNKDGEDFTPKNYVKTENGLTVSNHYTSPKDASAKAEKVWVNGPTEKPTIWFQLFRNIKDEEPVAVKDVEIKELTSGTTEVVWTGLDKTDASGNEYIYTVKEVDQDGADFTPTGFTKKEKDLTVTNTFEIAETDITATKVWVDGPAEKPTIWFQLFRNIKDEAPVAVDSIKKLKDGQTEATWTGLPETDANGNVYEYSVKEVNDEGEDFTPAGFTKKEKDLTVTNTYETAKTEITATKVWKNGPAEKPTIWFQLFRNVDGEAPTAVDEVKELSDGTTEVTWTDLAKTDASGNEYVYTVREVDADGQDFVPAGYDKAEKDLTVTNTFEIAETDITATKVWVDGPAEKPATWFQLFRKIEGGAKEAVPGSAIKKLKNGQTEVTWTALPETDLSGNVYEYSVKEVNDEGEDFTPKGYTKVEDGLTVTNTYEVKVKDITATKVWKEGPANRPIVWFQLFQSVNDQEPTAVADAEIKALENGTTKVTWTDLPETDADGNEYVYSVQEVDAEGNDFTPKNYVKVENGLRVTNTYVRPGNTYAKAEKVWVTDADERPTIWFQLFRQVGEGQVEAVDGAAIKELKSGTTEVVWVDLDKVDDDGNEYIYTVKEVDAQGNDFTPTNYDKVEDGLVVTNTYNKPDEPKDSSESTESSESESSTESSETTDSSGRKDSSESTDSSSTTESSTTESSSEPEDSSSTTESSSTESSSEPKDSSSTTESSSTESSSESTDSSSTTESSSTESTNESTDSSSTTESSSTESSSESTDSSSTTESSSTESSSESTDSSSTTESSSTESSSEPKDSSSTTESSTTESSSESTDSSSTTESSSTESSSEPKDSSSSSDSNEPKDSSSSSDSNEPKDSSSSSDSSEPKDSSSSSDSSEPKDSSGSSDSNEPKDSSSSSDSSEPQDSSSSSDSNEPKDSSSSSDSSEPKDSSSSSDSSEPKDSNGSNEPKDNGGKTDKDGKLPQTGSESTSWMQILGLAMVGFVGISYASYTRKNRKR